MFNYHPIPAESLLKDTVQAFWQFERLKENIQQETIIPKGVVEIIFNFSPIPDLQAQFENQSVRVPRCFINGYHTRPIVFGLAEQQTFFGIILYPASASKVVNIPLSEFANSCVDLTLENPELLSLWHQLSECGFDKRVALISQWLMKNNPELSKREQAFNWFLAKASAEHITHTALASDLCYSPRQLTRKLKELTAMNTEQTLLYKKYVQAINLMHTSDAALGEIAYATGFADQSHFIKSFQLFAGITPGQYKSAKSPYPGHLFEYVR